MVKLIKSETIETEWGLARTNKGGYFVINGKHETLADKLVHRLIYEKHHGPIPPDMVVHHIDGNKKNNKLSNLLVVTEVDHRRIHGGWIMEGGQWTKKPCGNCKKVLPLSEFQRRKRGRLLSYKGKCRPCSSKIRNGYYHKSVDQKLLARRFICSFCKLEYRPTRSTQTACNRNCWAKNKRALRRAQK